MYMYVCVIMSEKVKFEIKIEINLIFRIKLILNFECNIYF